MIRAFRRGALAVLAAVVVAAPVQRAGGVAASPLPRPSHVVVVIMENHAYGQIIGNHAAPWINSVAAHGALLTNSFGVAHPSEPNYLALFSGSIQGLNNDSCPHRYTSPNLVSALSGSRRSFRGYSESMPSSGFSGCWAGPYARKHNPWVNFANVAPVVNLPFSAFPRNYLALPTVAYVVPNLNHDMHDGTIAAGDTWLRQNLGGYLNWARTHNSLLVITWDEDDTGHGNRITTIIAGAHTGTTRYGGTVNHFRLLATIESFYGLTRTGLAARYAPITGIWTS